MPEGTLAYQLYVWKEEEFREWKGQPKEAIYQPGSFEMYDVGAEEVRGQIADYIGCDLEEIHLCYVGSPNQVGSEMAFGLRFWEFAYPEGIGSYVITLNQLEEGD